jgi:hypothetical protein
VLLFAIEPPDDDTPLILGIEKANAATRSPAAVYRKCHAITRCCPRGLGGRRDHRRAPSTIWQWHESYRTDRDHRTSDRWPLVLAAADHGLVQRADVMPFTGSPA